MSSLLRHLHILVNCTTNGQGAFTPFTTGATDRLTQLKKGEKRCRTWAYTSYSLFAGNELWVRIGKTSAGGPDFFYGKGTDRSARTTP